MARQPPALTGGFLFKMLFIFPDQFADQIKEVLHEAGIDVFGLDLATDRGKIQKRIRQKKSLEKVRWKVWERDDFTCQKCGSRRNLHVDHIFPESKGGKTILKNLQTLCANCNIKKGSKI